MSSPTQPSWFEHVDLMQAIIVILAFFIMGITTWVFKRLVSGFEKITDAHTAAITDLYNKHNGLAQDFHELKGEHKARVEC